MTQRAVITGWGKCLPPTKLTNHDLEELCETSDEWIFERTGIRERRISHVEATDLAEIAARRALACAGTKAEDLDLIIVATCTPETLVPSTAASLEKRLGAGNAAAFDLNAACSGFVYATSVVAALVESGFAERVLVVGSEKIRYVLDYRDRSTCIIFGDGAGAAIFEASDSGAGVLSTDMGADGESGKTMVFESCGTKGDPSSITDPSQAGLHFEGQAVYKMAVTGMAASATRAIEKAGIDISDVKLVIPHQANARIIQAAGRRLKLNDEQLFLNIESHGNTAAASIPMAISDAMESKKISSGDIVILTSFGGGITWGSTVLRWGERTAPAKISDAQLPPTQKTLLDILQPNLDFFNQYQPTTHN